MIILNEKQYAEECLYDRKIGEKPFITLSILAKYYYHCFDYRKKKITTLLTDFMEKYYPGYFANKSSWDESIDKIARNAGKYPLCEIDGISITDREMETIKSINNKTLEKLAFCALCIAKFGNIKNANNNGWVNIDEKELFKLARIAGNSDERNKKIGQLADLGLAEFPKRNDNMSFRITFIQDGKQVLFVSDFRELGYQYQQYCGKEFLKCAECGTLIKNSKNGRRKYCNNCSGYMPMQYKKVICIDCGKEFEVNALNNQTNRCELCYDIYRKRYKSMKESERYCKSKDSN